jgi:hypothetical protein
LKNKSENLFILLMNNFEHFLLVGTYIVESDYIAESLDELTIQKGDVIRGVVKSADGWLQGGCHGTTGLVIHTFI